VWWSTLCLTIARPLASCDLKISRGFAKALSDPTLPAATARFARAAGVLESPRRPQGSTVWPTARPSTHRC